MKRKTTPKVLPRVFISYSWDSFQHKAWVRFLAERLVCNGADVRLDQWHVKAGESFTQFMENEVATADYVLIICTPAYAQKASAREGGVGYEQQIVSGHLVSGTPRSRFIPIMRAGGHELGKKCAIPESFLGVVTLDFRDDEQFPCSLERLLRALFLQPEFSPPVLGKPPTLPATTETTLVSRSNTEIAAQKQHKGTFKISPRAKRGGRVGALALAMAVLVASGISSASILRHFRSREKPSTSAFLHIVPPTPAEKKRVVHDFSEPTYESFDLVSDRKTLDLRDWKNVPPDRMAEPTSPVTLTREIKARKKVAADTIRFQFSTGGLPMDFNCRTQNYAVEEKAPEPTGGKTDMQTTYQVVLDTSQIKIGDEFTAIIEATYWNAFQPPDETSMSMKIHAPVALVSMTLILPEQRSLADYRLWERVYGSKERRRWDERNGFVLASKTANTLYWEVPNPKVGDAYTIDWVLQ
jgi:hypothetical protein